MIQLRVVIFFSLWSKVRRCKSRVSNKEKYPPKKLVVFLLSFWRRTKDKSSRSVTLPATLPNLSLVYHLNSISTLQRIFIRPWFLFFFYYCISLKWKILSGCRNGRFIVVGAWNARVCSAFWRRFYFWFSFPEDKRRKKQDAMDGLAEDRATATELLLTTFHLGPLHVDAVTMVRTTSVERISWILKYVPSRRKPVDCFQGNNLWDSDTKHLLIQ